MALAFKAYLQEGDILVAHNSAFDFSELMNAMSGGQFMKQGVIDDIAAEEFAKTDFDFYSNGHSPTSILHRYFC